MVIDKVRDKVTQGSRSCLRSPGSPGPGNFEHRPVLRSQERSGNEGGRSLLRCWALDVRCWALNQFSNPREHPSDHCSLPKALSPSKGSLITSPPPFATLRLLDRA